jgi:hypothetical protein
VEQLPGQRQQLGRGFASGGLGLGRSAFGQLGIHLDLYPDKPLRLVGAEPSYVEIPTTESSLSALSKTLENIPLAEIADKFEKTMEGIEKLVNSLRVQAGRRLVQDDQVGVVNQGLGQADPALHALGKLPHRAPLHLPEADHLQQLLQEDHRYVFTLIQKFHIEGRRTYPKLSDRSDIIVMTDEAHRSQYDIMALNMRNALPHAAFIGFTGTPLMAGEERTRKVFGEYVSIYNFKQSVYDQATVPLYYENRIPALQLTNENLTEDI